MANSLDPIGAVCSGSTLAVCFYTYFVSNVRQLFAADDTFRCIFFLALEGLTHTLDKNISILRSSDLQFSPALQKQVIKFLISLLK